MAPQPPDVRYWSVIGQDPTGFSVVFLIRQINCRNSRRSRNNYQVGAFGKAANIADIVVNMTDTAVNIAAYPLRLLCLIKACPMSVNSWL